MQKINHIVLFDTETAFLNLLPLSATRPVSDFRVGILTIKEKWQRLCPNISFSQYSMDYINPVFADDSALCDDTLFVAGNIIPDSLLADRVLSMSMGEALVCGGDFVAFRGSLGDMMAGCFRQCDEPDFAVSFIRYVFDIFLLNADAVESDFRMLTDGRVSAPLSQSNMVLGDRMDKNGRPRIFIEEGAEIEGVTFNLKNGPIYIGKGAEIMECASLRGPVAICERAKVKMGTRVYGGTTIGPFCKIGGEIDNTVMFGYSNKAHDGYLGNAVIGEWCNIGAGTNASNLKNDYSKIRVWNYASHTFMRTSLQFCGLIMGDHSKAGINCMFNTATVVGVGCNLHGSGFPRVFIPSFSEGSPAGGLSEVGLSKFYTIAERAMARRGRELGEREREMYRHLYEQTRAGKKGSPSPSKILVGTAATN